MDLQSFKIRWEINPELLPQFSSVPFTNEPPQVLNSLTNSRAEYVVLADFICTFSKFEKWCKTKLCKKVLKDSAKTK